MIRNTGLSRYRLCVSLFQHNFVDLGMKPLYESCLHARYGAPGEGNILLDHCGIGSEFFDNSFDLSPYKQGKFLPGNHILLFHPDKIKETILHYLLIFPWNIKEETWD